MISFAGKKEEVIQVMQPTNFGYTEEFDCSLHFNARHWLLVWTSGLENRTQLIIESGSTWLIYIFDALGYGSFINE